jgi:DNA-binding response OmpR family regulator
MATAAREPRSESRVLVVDDDQASCELFADILHEAGFQPECAHNDVEAHRALQCAGRYAAIIMDVNLGRGITGFDVAQSARQITPDLGVRYVSGQATEDSFMTFGVSNSSFMKKPFEAQDLLLTLEILLSGSASLASACSRKRSPKIKPAAPAW